MNSIRARKDRFVAWAKRSKSDVICLQELKVEDSAFPTDVVKELGFESAVFGQKTYNGVAVLAKRRLKVLSRGFNDSVDDPQARFIDVEVEDGPRVMCGYIPNGAQLTSPKFVYKLEWLARLDQYLRQTWNSKKPMLIAGDFNIVPEPIDVYDPAGWEGEVLFSEPERTALRHLVSEHKLVDSLRTLFPKEVLYTWWDYRDGGFPKNKGLRIDHMFVSEALRSKLKDAGVDRDERKGALPSDHAPVWIELKG